jgi:hypothetical protein
MFTSFQAPPCFALRFVVSVSSWSTFCGEKDGEYFIGCSDMLIEVFQRPPKPGGGKPLPCPGGGWKPGGAPKPAMLLLVRVHRLRASRGNLRGAPPGAPGKPGGGPWNPARKACQLRFENCKGSEHTRTTSATKAWWGTAREASRSTRETKAGSGTANTCGGTSETGRRQTSTCWASDTRASSHGGSTGASGTVLGQSRRGICGRRTLDS